MAHHVQPHHHDTKSIAGSSDTIGVDVLEQRRDDSYGETDANVVSVEGKIKSILPYKILHSDKSFSLYDSQMPLWNTMM